MLPSASASALCSICAIFCCAAAGLPTPADCRSAASRLQQGAEAFDLGQHILCAALAGELLQFGATVAARGVGVALRTVVERGEHRSRVVGQVVVRIGPNGVDQLGGLRAGELLLHLVEGARHRGHRRGGRTDLVSNTAEGVSQFLCAAAERVEIACLAADL